LQTLTLWLILGFGDISLVSEILLETQV
jgi:hypothetical protein